MTESVKVHLMYTVSYNMSFQSPKPFNGSILNVNILYYEAIDQRIQGVYYNRHFIKKPGNRQMAIVIT